MSEENMKEQLIAFVNGNDDLYVCIKWLALMKILEGMKSDGSISEKMKILTNKTQDEITNLNSNNKSLEGELEKLHQSNEQKKDLVKQESELKQKHLELINLKNLISELETKKTEIEKPENAIDDLNDEITKINEIIVGKLNDYIIQLNALNTILENSDSVIEKETHKIVSQAISNIEAIANKQYSIIEKLSNEPVKTIYESFHERIGNLTYEYNVYVEKIESIKNDLELIENKHSNIVESFKIHELENETVYGNLRKIGEMDGVNVYVENLQREIKDKLAAFDNIIKSLIEKKKKLPIFERI